MGQYSSKFIHHECDEDDSDNEGTQKRATKEVIIYTWMFYLNKLTITFLFVYYVIFIDFQSSETEEQNELERDELENHQYFIDDEDSDDGVDLSIYHR